MTSSYLPAAAIESLPVQLKEALGVRPGDWVKYSASDDGAVLLTKIDPNDPWENPFASFTEWSDELDSIFDDL